MEINYDYIFTATHSVELFKKARHYITSINNLNISPHVPI